MVKSFLSKIGVKMEVCPLCLNISKLFYEKEFYHCDCCDGIFRTKQNLLDSIEEKKRYDYHVNNADDLRYQRFVSPITNSIIEDRKISDIGLDFGCGRDSPIVKVLNENSYQILKYDPYFFNDKTALEKKYDFIACCEVIEHFYNPRKEFELFKKLLKEDGALYLMTGIYNSSMDFGKWGYKSDPTHVFIFQEKTFEWIKKEFGFKELKIEKNFIRLSLRKE